MSNARDMTVPMDSRRGRAATLLISSHCPHCARTLAAVVRLVKGGKLSRLEILNLDQEPEAARRYAVRQVPWLRIGPFELTGALSDQEAERWAEHAAAGTGFADYAASLLERQGLDRVLVLVREDPGRLAEMLSLLEDDEQALGVRIGVSAVIESLAGEPVLRAAVPVLQQLCLAPSAQTRADACHFLGLAGDPTALQSVRRLLADDDQQVREIAEETIEMLTAGSDGARDTP